MDTRNKNSTHKKVASYLSALTAAGCESVTHPLDTAAKRLQNHKGHISLFKSDLKALRTVMYPSQTSSLCEGFSSALSYRLVNRTLTFGTKPLIKFHLDERFNHGFMQGSPYQSTVFDAASGSLAGLSEVLVLPLDKLKVCRQLGDNTPLGAFVGREKFKLYQGATVTALRNMFAFGTLYAVSNLTHQHLFKTQSDHSIPLHKNYFASTLGAASAIVFSNPLDVVKTRVQKQNQSAMNVARQIINENGIRGFGKGVFPRLFIRAPKLALVKSVTEHLTPSFERALERGDELSRQKRR